MNIQMLKVQCLYKLGSTICMKYKSRAKQHVTLVKVTVSHNRRPKAPGPDAALPAITNAVVNCT